MPASQEQKVDFLLKKIGYSASKTGIAEDESAIGINTNTQKAPFAEDIPSPLVIPSSSLWGDTSYIPTTPPGSDTAYVKVYSTSSALRMTRDSTVGSTVRTYIAYTTYNNTSSARLTNWIDTQFGANYILKVYKGDPNSSGTELTQVGGNNKTDGWFFDYSSGVLNFNGVNTPDGIDATNIYIVGYRYIGRTGVQPPAGIGTFESLYVSGISTFVGDVNANSNVIIGGNLTVNGTQTILNTNTLSVEDINIGIASATSPLNDLQLDGAGITIHSSNVDKTITWNNTNSWIGINTTFNASRIVGSATTNIIPFLYANYDDLPSASSYHGAFVHAHSTGKGYFAHAGNWMELVNRETTGIVGTGTDNYKIGSLGVTGITTINQLKVGTIGQTLVGITTILDEDNMTSDSATALATQQSIKKYIDDTVTAQDLDIAGDSGTGAVDLDSQSLTIAGTSNEIETSASNQTVTVGLPNNVTIGNNLTVTALTDTNTLTTGNATFTGTVSAGSTTGTNGYYLKSVGTGVTWAAFPSSRTGLTTSATAGQTSFNFSYNVGFVDVFVNGVKLPASEFTASNGSTVVLDDAAFADDTLEFISLNTLPITSAGAQNLTGLADVTISGTPVIGETLQHNGSVFVNDYTPSTTTTSTSQTAIHSLAVATYRSAEYTIQITEGTKYHVTKVLAIHNGTNVYFNEYGTLFTNNSLSTFALDVNSGNMRLLATPASTNSTVFKVKFTGIKV